MNGYERRTIQKRTEIIKAASELFAQYGIASVSITDIAIKAKVSRVTLFKYFGDKEALCKEVIYNWMESLIEEYKEILLSDNPFQQKMLVLLNMRLIGREKIGEQLIQSVAWHDTELQNYFLEISATHALPLILGLIDEGKHGGYIDSSLDDEAILAFFSAIGSIARDPKFIKKNTNFQKSIYNLVMGGLVQNWNKFSEGFIEKQYDF